MKKKSLSMVIVLTLLLAMTNQFVLARDYKDGSSAEYVTNFEDDLENHPDINVNQRNYLTADYYQTKAFNGLNLLAAPDAPEDTNWELFASDILKLSSNGAKFTTDTTMPLGYGAAVFNEDTDIDAMSELPKLTSPYGKKIVASGYFVPVTTGAYTLGAISDEGIRLTFDGVVYDEHWSYADSADHSYSVGTLTAGKIYPMQMEYFENQQEGANFTLIVNGDTTDEIKGYFYPTLAAPVNYTLDIFVNQIGSVIENDYVEYIEHVAFKELLGTNQVDFTSNLYSDDLVIGKEFEVKAKHVDGYIYVIYHRTIELVPIDGSDTFEEKEVWVYYKTETDVDPSISSRLLNDETYAVNYIPYDYKATFAVHTNSLGLGTVSPVGTVLMNRDSSIVVTATPSSGYQFVQWWGEFEIPATAAEIAKALEDEVALVRQFKLLQITDMTQATATFVADGSLVATNGEVQLMDRYLDNDEVVDVTKVFAEFRVIPTPTPTPSNNTSSTTSYQLILSSTIGGHVPGFEGTNTYSSGTNVMLTTVVEPGYEFIGWTGDTESLTNNVLVMTKNSTVVANFALMGTTPVDPDIEPEFPVVPVEPTVPTVPVVVDDEDTPEDAPVLDADLVDEDLPKAGGIPMELVTLAGLGVLGLGVVIKKRK